MTAMEATKQDWEDLKKRVENRTVPGKRQEWPGQDDPELWVNIVGEKQKEKKLQQEIDQAIRAGNSRYAEKKSGEETEAEDSELLGGLCAFLFLAGMMMGAAALFLAQYFI